jgi:hypothetical protein
MRVVFVIVLLAVTIALAVELGTRMSTEALGVVLGVACGVAAGIPMSVLVLAALQRRTDAGQVRGSPPGMPQQSSYPPVVVIQGGTPVPNTAAPPYYPGAVEASARQFRIVGEDDQ